MAHENQPRADVDRVEAADFESLGRKLEQLHATLSPSEAHVFAFLMESAAAGAAQFPPPPWLVPRFTYRPRGARHLITGGNEGLTVVITGRGKIIIVHGDPLPTEFPNDALGAIPIRGDLLEP